MAALGAEHVEHVEADVFAYAPEPAAYDTVFFSFWFTHVPPERVEGFWSMVASALRPGGRASFVDNVWDDGLWSREGRRRENPLQQRTDLSSGRAYTIVKVYYDPDQLAALLQGLGWSAEVGLAGRSLLTGWATPPAAATPSA
jgi:demethylmenaquinone methyltransferase/2-methoxy-6-polyprenyl-1,4-benzoquinol methylase